MNVTLSVGEPEDDPEKSIEEFKQLSGKGNSRGWRFNRDEIHSRSNDSETGIGCGHCPPQG
jgi:hypothetical protein